MTPEERAADWFTLPPSERTKENLAKWFEYAENDAIERAVCGLDYEWDQAASYVRSRKTN